MLKMTIDNEEVLSNNNFSINEEILSPSSTILNNVYPKSWELDKDYTSRFYYPKDYSKFELTNITHIAPIEGQTTTIDGNGTIENVDKSKENHFIKLDGNIIQDGTPSPDYPQPINITTGLQEVNVVGSNLIGNDTRQYPVNLHAGDKITFKNSGTSNCNLNLYTNLGDSTRNDYWSANVGTERTITVARDSKAIAWSTSPNGNAQVNYGTTLLTYEPYKGNTYEVNLGKNLIEPIFDEIISAYGVTYTFENDGLIVNGTPTSNTSVIIMNNKKLGAGTYSINGISGAGNNQYQLVIYKNNTIIRYQTTSDYTFTLEEDDLLTLRFYVYTNHGAFNNFKVQYQLERNGKCTPYSPYFTPIELGKIGNYQDKIFRNTNLFNFRQTPTMQLGDVKLKDNGVYIDFQGEEEGVGIQYTLNLTPNKPYRLICDLVKEDVSAPYLFLSRTGHNYYINDYGENAHVDVVFTPTTNETTLSIFLDEEVGTHAKGSVKNIYIGEGEEFIPYGEYGDWYLHKEIGKVAFDGTTIIDITLSGTTYKGLYRSSYPPNKINTSEITAPPAYYERAKYVRTNSEKGENTFYDNPTNFLIIGSTTDTLDTLKAKFNGGLLYYVLANPTNTKITNENYPELLSGLNEIELIDGLNNISINGDLAGYITFKYNFVNEDEIIDTIFSGMVKNTGDISLNPREAKYCSLEVLDYKTLLSEGDTLDFVISNKTINQAIEMVVDAISKYGFELGNININNGDEIIGAYSTDNKTAYDVLQYLADISGAKWNCRRKDDKSMYIDFYDPTLLPKGKAIEYTTEWACQNNLVNLSFNYGTRDYRNKQVIISNEVYGDIDYTENKAGDAYTREFILANKIGAIKEILVNGVPVSYATDVEKDMGVYAEFYYKVGDNVLTSNTNNPPLNFGKEISITYTPIIKGREVVQDDIEIDRISNQLEVNGTIARYEERNDETETSKLLSIGETYLKYKGEAEINLSVQTKDNDLYDVGQMVYFYAPIPELARNYLVKSKEINIISTDGGLDHIFYTYELSSSFNSEKAVNWFDNQRSKAEGNIKDGEYITRNIDISSDATVVWDNYLVVELPPVDTDNELNAPLDAPLMK